MAHWHSEAERITPPGSLTPTVELSELQIDNEKADVSDTTEDIIVDFDGPDDPLNPKKLVCHSFFVLCYPFWSRRKKWAATMVVSCFTFISPVSSSMVAPASAQVAEGFGIHSDVIVGLVTSIFVLAFAIGPLFLGPLSEIFGRNRIIQGANLWFLIWNIGCGFAQNTGQLLAFRFLAGLGGSAPLAVGGGVLGDIWDTEERGQAIAIYSLAPLLGPVIGPLCGAWIAERSTWRWVFWSTSIVDVAIQMLGLLYLRESYAPFLLEQKAKQTQKSLDAEMGPIRNVRSVFATADRTWARIMKTAIIRPFVLFINEPILQALGIYMAFQYGLFYLFLTSMPLMFQGVYGETVGISGLNYIALGIGFTGASQVNARMMDGIYKRLKEKNGGEGRPEYRLPAMFPGVFALPIGLFIVGWTVQAKVHWIVPDIVREFLLSSRFIGQTSVQGIVLVGVGMILTYQCIQLYLIDVFTLYAASALASVGCLRSILGFVFPLFAEQLYKTLGYGKGDTLLAVFAIAFGCPSPFLLWNYGPQLRKRSKFAEHST
ncbi:MFS polyamine transporter [Favolaschia claudopus]|uniref:MFS polyamine transporter n=1 Tax=Favolaschia claudopus TaxID=2862362 RepID=A0AAW0DCC1_9AGAR